MKRKGFKNLEVEHHARHLEVQIAICNQKILQLQVRRGLDNAVKAEFAKRQELMDELAELFLLCDEEDEDGR